MTISFEGYTGLYESALNLRAKRSEVIAGNLANADTPNYKARDFDFHTALQSSMDTTRSKDINLTNSRHFALDSQHMGGVEMNYRTPTQPSIDGNTVEEQVEHAAFMENTLEFQAAFTLLNNRFKGLSGAIKGE